MKRSVLVGHRGCPLEFPENSLQGIVHALELGALYLEIDIQVTSDLQVVLHHDRTLARSCGVEGAVQNYTYDELKRFSFSEPDFFGSRFQGTGPLLLSELLTLTRQREEVTLFIEVKPVAVESFGVEPVLQALQGVTGAPRPNEVLISYRLDLLNSCAPFGWKRSGWILDAWDRDLDTEAPGMEFLFCNVSRLPEEGSVHRPGHKLGVYDLIEPEPAIRLLERGVDLLETFDLPGMLDAGTDGSEAGE